MRIIYGMKYPKTVAELISLGSAILFFTEVNHEQRKTRKILQGCRVENQ